MMAPIEGIDEEKFAFMIDTYIEMELFPSFKVGRDTPSPSFIFGTVTMKDMLIHFSDNY